MVTRIGSMAISIAIAWQLAAISSVEAQETAPPTPPGESVPEGAARPQGPPGGFGGRGFGPPPGFGEERQLRRQFDADGNGWLDRQERQKAREEAPPPQRGFGRPGGGGFGGPGRGSDREPPKAGRKIEPGEVSSHPMAGLYDPLVLRTLFLEFEGDDWEEELEAFNNTDVEVPATLTVDGKQYQQVGVHFRGQSSYMMVPRGYMRSLNLSLDFLEEDQQLHGYRTLNLLNANGDASLMSSILYADIAREYLPVPKVNFVHVVINGESWGIYVSAQQFNKDFLRDNYETTQGTRWKVDGSPMGDGGLRYLGEEIAPYRERFAIKSKENEAAWRRLIELCRTLEQTPPDQLQSKLEGLVDIDNVLWFLALDVALVNSDGYWVRASDYSLYLDPKGCFHFIPHDMNEAFRGGGGPGFGFRTDRRGGGPGNRPPREGEGRDREPGPPPPDGPPRFGPPRGLDPDVARDGEGGPREFRPGPGGRRGFGGPGGGPREGGPKLEPLVATDDPRMPLRSKLLNVPEFRASYLEKVRQIAEKSLDWTVLGPKIDSYRELIEAEVDQETRRLTSASAFHAAVGPVEGTNPPELEKFLKERREFLLQRTEELLRDKP